MDKRYQVFVSSTFRDLIEERQQVTSMLMKMNCIPAGMELFPAVDLEQFEFIKKIIDDSDYYIVMIAGKYGSISPETGISYTEMEYNYAVEKGKKIIALIHKNINNLTREKIETDPVIAEKLEDFRNKVSSSRLVNYWTNQDEIPGHVAVSLTQTITLFTAEGWVRAGKAPSEQILIELNELRKENDELKSKLKAHNQLLPDLAELTNQFKLSGTYRQIDRSTFRTINWQYECSWDEIFAMIAPSLLTLKSPFDVRRTIAKMAISKIPNSALDNLILSDDVFNIIKVQLLAYNFVDIRAYPTKDGGTGEFWKITDRGRDQMMKSMSIKN